MAKPNVGSCCRNCTERFPACHDVCATYLEAKAERDEWLDTVRKNKEKDWDYRGFRRVTVGQTKRVMDNKRRK